jgi:hypothetical protein
MQLKEKHGMKVQVFAAPSILDTDPCRKPNTGMWEYFATNCNSGIKPGGWHLDPPQSSSLVILLSHPPSCLSANISLVMFLVSSDGNDGNDGSCWLGHRRHRRLCWTNHFTAHITHH